MWCGSITFNILSDSHSWQVLLRASGVESACSALSSETPSIKFLLLTFLSCGWGGDEGRGFQFYFTDDKLSSGRLRSWSSAKRKQRRHGTNNILQASETTSLGFPDTGEF